MDLDYGVEKVLRVVCTWTMVLKRCCGLHLDYGVEKVLRVVCTWTMVLKSGYIRYVLASQRVREHSLDSSLKTGESGLITV